MKYTMKNYSLNIFQLLLVLLLTFSSCSHTKVPIIELVVLADVSDDNIKYTTYGEIREIFDFKQFLYYEHKVRVRELSDIRSGIVAASVLPAADEDEVPENLRKPQVRSFLTKTEQLLNAPKNNTEKNQSILFYGIADELNRLATQSTATNKIAIINSNLLENNDYFSVFKESDKQLLFHHPDSVIRIFEKQLPIQNLKGVSVYIVHHSNPDTDHLFSEMAKLYNYYLGLKGAQVNVVANFISANIQPENDTL